MRLFSLLFTAFVAIAHAQDLPRRGTLGIPLRAAPEAVRTELKIGAQEGLEVIESANGLEKGDVIIGVARESEQSTVGVTPFKSFLEWNELLRAWTDKPLAKLAIKRKGSDGWKELLVDVKIQPKPKDETENYSTLYDFVTSSGHKIRTIVTKPKSPGKHPVLFWIQGINASTVDYPLTAQNYLTRPIKAFADDGYVTVRVEKPGVGDSEGGPARLVGWEEEMDIYRQALKALDKYDFVDRDKVFVFGHSMGGCHAPVVCADVPVKGIITYGTVSNSWLEWAVRAPRIQGILSGQTHAQVDQDVRKTAQFYTYLYTEKRSIAWIKENHPELAKFCDENSPDGVMLGDRSIRYMQEVNDRNFCEWWPKLGKTRVLALFGEFDWIALKEDSTQVADCVNAANPGMADFQIVPQSDHIFEQCSSMKESFANFNRLPANPEIIRIMKEWIARVS
ncbi:MAG: alpha/beta hydrolase [Armatimonadetes bacterium]|nr:alpha/beta hydrolase [Armatimonadota bacterium]